MKRRPVYLGAVGHFSARGEGLVAVTDALSRQETAHTYRHVGGRQWPFFACRTDHLEAREASRELIQSLTRQWRASALLSEGEFSNTPLFIGSSSGFIGQLEKAGAHAHQKLPSAADYAGQVAQWIGTQGTPRCFSTACTSSIAALDAAALLIGSGQLKRALVVGMELANDTTLGGFASLGLLTTTYSKPLDVQRDGMTLGEAVAGILLSAEPAVFPSGHVWRLSGLDMRLETHSITGPNPDGSLVAETMRNALQQAGLPPTAIDVIKLQASGSPTADLAEALAIRRIFGDHPPPLVSLKPYFGHALGASGTVELSALTACLDLGWIPATPGFAHLDPAIGLKPTHQLLRSEARHALFNLSGFGGAAALVISRQQS